MIVVMHATYWTMSAGSVKWRLTPKQFQDWQRLFIESRCEMGWFQGGIAFRVGVQNV